MRPSYDAEHPNSATPIYDSLYSEYRRLFRALPGDRSGEENMKFTGFAVRDPHTLRPEALPYPQHQTFHTFPGHTQGTPQFMPAQQSHVPGLPAGGGNDGSGAAAGGGSGSAGGTGQGAGSGSGQFGATSAGQSASGGAAPFGAGGTGQFGGGDSGPYGGGPDQFAGTGGQFTGPGSYTGAGQTGSTEHLPAAGQFGGTGQGWVAAGYLGSPPSSSRGGPTTSGRHRFLVALPPGRVPGQG
ncbi:hypothetical protein [Kitasatospora camelliae]|uniref:Uncharacterized protein n=1 Tax=Kitasatospora camelliae TaxID=3156397 RepID=A0AAU8K1S6_9ACTN